MSVTNHQQLQQPPTLLYLGSSLPKPAGPGHAVDWLLRATEASGVALWSWLLPDTDEQVALAFVTYCLEMN